MSEQQETVKREKVRVIPIKYIDNFPEHPFQVKEDESMQQKKGLFRYSRT